MGVLFVDLDGTLFNSDARFNECLKEVGATDLKQLRGEQRRKFWDCYQSPRFMHLDTPKQEVVDFVRDAKDKGWFIVVLTGRTEAQKEATLSQLSKFGIPFDVLIMRKQGDYRKDYEYKGSVISRFKPLTDDLIIIDDSEEVRRIMPEYSLAPDRLEKVRPTALERIQLPDLPDVVVVRKDSENFSHNYA